MDGANRGLDIRDDSLRQLNRRFLGMAVSRGAPWPLPRFVDLCEEELAAAAACPFALFDVRFSDSPYWAARLQSPSAWRVADVPKAASDAVEFVRLALFYVWHVTISAPLHTQLLLGMPREVASAFALLTVDRLPAIALAEAGNLTPRWPTCDVFWNALIDAASMPSGSALRRAQLRGIQFAAANRLAIGPIAGVAL